MVKNLVKKFRIGVTLIGLVFGGFGCAGGEIYFPAGKDPHLNSRIEEYIESQKGSNEGVYVGMPILVSESKN